MNMNISIDDTNGEPIYLRIAGQTKALIPEGKLKEDEMLSSMRSLAPEPRISFMTTKRAYEEPERGDFFLCDPENEFAFLTMRKARCPHSLNISQ